VDVLAAHHLKEGLLVALLHRQKTGEGSLVEVSLIQAALTSLTNQATNWLVAGRLPQRQGSAHPNIAPYGDSFVTSDGKRILLAIGSDRQFHDLVQVLKLEEVIAADLFSTNPLRVANRDKLNVILAEGIRLHTADALIQNLNAKKIPAGVIQNVREAFLMPEAEEILLREGSTVGVRNFVGTISGWERSKTILPPPHFGEHTSDILTKLSTL
jgi:crotonobetainyl-CoA:carnitine CoA-transferase CaiB-like acyl-CoA transferase